MILVSCVIGLQQSFDCVTYRVHFPGLFLVVVKNAQNQLELAIQGVKWHSFAPTNAYVFSLTRLQVGRAREVGLGVGGLGTDKE